MSLLEVEHLAVEFATVDGQVKAVRDVSFSVEAGTVLGVVGESGSGKTVAALTLMQLLPENATVTSGRVTFDGQDVLGMRGKGIRALRGSRVSMIFQDPMTALDPVERISKQIADAVRYHQPTLGRAQVRAKVLGALDTVGVPDVARRADQYPHQWSGGMRQRAMIAMALVNEPDLIIADEPTTALDATVQAQVLEVIAQAREDRGCAVIFISHDLAVVRDLADEVMVMYAGMVAERAPSKQLFADARHPYTRALMLARPGWSTRAERLFTIPGRPPDLLHPPTACNFVARCPDAHGLALCSEVQPPLRELRPGHLAACHRADELEPMEVGW